MNWFVSALAKFVFLSAVLVAPRGFEGGRR